MSTSLPPGWTCINDKCSPNCGDGQVYSSENCDDGKVDDKGCLSDCSGAISGWICTAGSETTPSACEVVCGDGINVDGEICDDGNTVDSDGCLGNCSGFEKDFKCWSKSEVPTKDQSSELKLHSQDTLCKKPSSLISNLGLGAGSLAAASMGLLTI